ncbi:MAG: hypothetical protein JF616_01240 [Fibrobacteres bacterium]|jgi:hypothetical protein|nr:hypothetical protein [Fibrobacterota bacterium]
MLTRWSHYGILLPPALLAFTSLAPIAASETPALILSEILADPAAWLDAQGEFLELGHPGNDSTRLDGVTITVDGQSFLLGPLLLGPSDCFLICRDSTAYARAGIACARGWAGMTLVNGRPLDAAVSWAGGNFHVTAPASRPGTSWENTWDAAAGYTAFLPSLAGKAGGDSATPGSRNSRSTAPAGRDLALAGIEAAGSSVRVTVESRGSGPPPRSWVALRLDSDWDGIPEATLDSVSLDSAGEYPATLEFRIPAGTRGRVSASLSPDENPGDNVMAVACEPGGGPLAFGAFQAVGQGGAPEWVEIRNVTSVSGGTGRRIALSLATVDAMALETKAGVLDPGERIILTSDTAAFRARFGPIKANVVRPEPWRALRNTGDTLILRLAGIAVDTLSWGPIKPGAPEAGNDLPAGAGWNLSGRTAFPEAPLEVEVLAPAGADYVLRAFSLEGDIVREIGRGGAGRRVHAWDGRGAGGRALPRGAYVLCLTFGDGRTRKRAIVAGER